MDAFDRDLLERRVRPLLSAGVAVPHLADYKGLAAIDGLRDTVRLVADWTKVNL